MIVKQEVIDAIRLMRRIGADTQRCEVKKSVQELPRNLPETISAFSNMHGGMIILGLKRVMDFVQLSDLKQIGSISSYKR